MKKEIETSPIQDFADLLSNHPWYVRWYLSIKSEWFVFVFNCKLWSEWFSGTPRCECGRELTYSEHMNIGCCSYCVEIDNGY